MMRPDDGGRPYTLVYVMGPDGWWIVTAPFVPGCRTQAASLAQGRRRIIAALALWDPRWRDATFVDDVKLEPEAQAHVDVCRAARAAADAAAAVAARETATRAVALRTQARLGLRDIGTLLGMSHQRVAQILAAHETGTRP